MSKPRNRCLIEALRVLRLAERAGTGVDVMVRAMIRAGHPPPVFSSGGGGVRVVLDGGAPVTRLAAMIASLPVDVQDDTDAILAIHYLRTHPTVDAARIAPILQKSAEEASEALRRLSDDAYDLLEPARETRRYRMPTYRFRERVRAELGTLLPYHRNDADESDRRIVAHLREYGTVSNQTVQNLLGRWAAGQCHPAFARRTGCDPANRGLADAWAECPVRGGAGFSEAKPPLTPAAPAPGVPWGRGDLEALPVGVTRLVVESRHHRQDAKDLAVLAAASRGRWIEFSHVPGKGKHTPELWLADIAAGALAAQLVGGPDYRAYLSTVLARFECE